MREVGTLGVACALRTSSLIRVIPLLEMQYVPLRRRCPREGAEAALGTPLFSINALHLGGTILMRIQQRVQVCIGALALMIALSACSQPLTTREKGTLLGGGLGAASGAIIGAAVGSPGAGAAIGGAMGALSGGLIGDQLQNSEYRAAYQQGQISRQSREIQRQRRDIKKLKRQTRSAEDEY